MPSTPPRDVKKRLYEFAKHEYNSKKPVYVEVRKAKGVKTFYRGPVPQLILTKYKPIAYIVFADYDSLGRLYYFNRDGYCIKDTSYSEDALGKIKKHLKKTTIRLLRYPKLKPSPTISEQTVALDEQFAKIIVEIEKITNYKLSSRPIITLNSKAMPLSENILTLLEAKSDFWQLPIDFSALEEKTEILTIKAFDIFFENILKRTPLARKFSFLASMLFLKDRHSQELILNLAKRNKWSVGHFDREERYKQKEISNLFDYCKLISATVLTNDFPLSFLTVELEEELLESFYHSLFEEVDSFARFSSATLNYCLTLLARKECKQVPLLLTLTVILHVYSSRVKEDESKEKSLSALPARKEIKYCIKQNGQTKLVIDFLQAILEYKVKTAKKLFMQLKEVAKLPVSLQKFWHGCLESLIKKSISVVVQYTLTSFGTAGDLVIKIFNRSDVALPSFQIKELSWKPRDALESIGVKRHLRKKMLAPGEELLFTQPVLAKRKGTVKLSNLELTFGGLKGERIIYLIPLPKLKIS